MTDSDDERLEALLGTWKTNGWTKETPDAPAAKIDAVDSDEWFRRRRALALDARTGDEKDQGAETIGYNPDRGAFVTQYFGSDVPAAYEANLSQGGEGLTWRMPQKTDRSQASSARMAASSPGIGSGG